MSTLFLTFNTAAGIEPDTLVLHVPKRPTITVSGFGAWLAEKRAGRSFEQIAQRLRPLVEPVGLKVDRSTVKKLEQGRVPSWPMIGALSRVYDVPVEDTVRRLVAALEFPDAPVLFCHTVSEQSALPTVEGGADVPASARLLVVERERDAARTALREMQAAASRVIAKLADIAARGIGEDAASPAAQPATRGRRRKASG